MTSTDVERDHPGLVASAQNLLGDLAGFERRLTTPSMEYAHHCNTPAAPRSCSGNLRRPLFSANLISTHRLSPSFGPLWSKSCSTV